MSSMELNENRCALLQDGQRMRMSVPRFLPVDKSIEGVRNPGGCRYVNKAIFDVHLMKETQRARCERR